jgi:hypothetical protein
MLGWASSSSSMGRACRHIWISASIWRENGKGLEVMRLCAMRCDQVSKQLTYQDMTV